MFSRMLFALLAAGLMFGLTGCCTTDFAAERMAHGNQYHWLP